MISEKIHSILQVLIAGGQSAPLLVSEETVQDILQETFHIDRVSPESLEEKSIPDFFWYDCADKKHKKHQVDTLRKFTEQLYQTPA